MNFAPQLRTLLLLGRGADLPTVWSNCLAGWWLAGGGNHGKLPFLLLGVSALYTGGGFLNDAFDEESDRQRRAERPISGGKIAARHVWQLGFGQLALGIILLLFCGKIAAGAAVLLALTILIHGFTHQFFTAASWLLGACRCWVYVIAGATAVASLNGWAIFGGLAMMFYVAGSGGIVRRGNFRAAVPLWPLLLLAAPVLLALAMNAGSFRLAAIWISVVVVLWIARCVRTVIAGGIANPGLIAANLLSGIALVDWLAVAPDCPRGMSLLLLALFGLTKGLQKFLPTA